MSLVSHAFNAAIVGMIMAPLCVADDHANVKRYRYADSECTGGSIGGRRMRCQTRRDLTRGSGPESIDFLDIVFRLEREFMIKIPQGELFSELLVRGVTDILHDGQVTDPGMAALRALQLPVRRLDGHWTAAVG